jgi:hypothetical protein
MTTYTLKDKTPVACEDMMEWGRWFQTSDRQVKLDLFTPDVRVSTVFLGMDHSFNGDYPVLFETMIFGIEEDGYQTRCSTWDEAIFMHAEALIYYKNYLLSKPPLPE